MDTRPPVLVPSPVECLSCCLGISIKLVHIIDKHGELDVPVAFGLEIFQQLGTFLKGFRAQRIGSHRRIVEMAGVDDDGRAHGKGIRIFAHGFVRDFSLVHKSQLVIHTHAGPPEVRSVRVPVKVADDGPFPPISSWMCFDDADDFGHKIRGFICIGSKGDCSRLNRHACMLCIQPVFRLDY